MEPKIFWVRVSRTGVRIRKAEKLLRYEIDAGLFATQPADYIFFSL